MQTLSKIAANKQIPSIKALAVSSLCANPSSYITWPQKFKEKKQKWYTWHTLSSLFSCSKFNHFPSGRVQSAGIFPLSSLTWLSDSLLLLLFTTAKTGSHRGNVVSTPIFASSPHPSRYPQIRSHCVRKIHIRNSWKLHLSCDLPDFFAWNKMIYPVLK